jgi:hypothetical protein
LTAGFQSAKEIEMAPANRKAAPRRNSSTREPGNPATLAPPIAPGTPCFIVGRPTSQHAFALGRVVTVARGPRGEFGGPGPFYEVTAHWLAQRFPMVHVVIVHRGNLRPIAPDAPLESHETTRRTPVEAA